MEGNYNSLVQLLLWRTGLVFFELTYCFYYLEVSIFSKDALRTAQYRDLFIFCYFRNKFMFVDFIFIRVKYFSIQNF